MVFYLKRSRSKYARGKRANPYRQAWRTDRTLRRGFNEAAHYGKYRRVNSRVRAMGRKRVMSKVMYRKGLPAHLRKYINKFIY